MADENGEKFVTYKQFLIWLSSSLIGIAVLVVSVGTWAMDNHSKYPHPTGVSAKEFIQEQTARTEGDNLLRQQIARMENKLDILIQEARKN